MRWCEATRSEIQISRQFSSGTTVRRAWFAYAGCGPFAVFPSAGSEPGFHPSGRFSHRSGTGRAAFRNCNSITQTSACARFMASSSPARIADGRGIFDRTESSGAKGTSGHQRASARIISAAFSPIIMTGALVLPPISVGMIEASTTRRPARPCTRKAGSTTAIASIPILQVPTG